MLKKLSCCSGWFEVQSCYLPVYFSEHGVGECNMKGALLPLGFI